MLGAPAQKVELDDQQIELCVKESFSFFESNTGNKPDTSDQKVIQLLQEGALVFAKIMLGRIRAKKYPPDDNLSQEAAEHLESLKEQYLNYFPDFQMFKDNTMQMGTPPSGPVSGLLVVYVNVGTLPPFKAKEYVSRFKTEFDLTAIKEHCEIVYIPTRTRETTVKYIRLK